MKFFEYGMGNHSRILSEGSGSKAHDQSRKMRLDEFDYPLDSRLIAQSPCERRDRARMMIVDRDRSSIEDDFFYNLAENLKAGDVLVVNDTKVIPAKLTGRKLTGGNIEILLLSKREGRCWEVLLKPGRRARIGLDIFFEDGSQAKILERLSDRKWILEFRVEKDFEDFLDRCGTAPLPPYIKRSRIQAASRQDLDRYQTVYAKVPGSVAAPTAGLHFTEDMMAALKSGAIEIVPVTLHVGYGTFLPIEAEFVEEHRMEEEFFEISKEAAEAINRASRVIAVGTTSTRVVETASDDSGRVEPRCGFTGLYIYPGYRFKRVGGLVTNFHLPKSSLFLLVCAFAGRELIRSAYRRAAEEKYRFYSYGDCMLIL
ncbi:MAG: tRNA preQ1(34) S-adenosylmethionine ribosyltransferase-isomerase QueA [Syntrophales bacterium]